LLLSTLIIHFLAGSRLTWKRYKNWKKNKVTVFELQPAENNNEQPQQCYNNTTYNIDISHGVSNGVVLLTLVLLFSLFFVDFDEKIMFMPLITFQAVQTILTFIVPLMFCNAHRRIFTFLCNCLFSDN
jgi:hypothetical protein